MNEEAMGTASRQRAARLALGILSAVWGVLGMVSLPMALRASEIFNDPELVDDTGAWLLFIGAAGFPLIVLASLILGWFFYKRRRYGVGLAMMLLPFLNIVAGLAGAIMLGWFRQV